MNEIWNRIFRALTYGADMRWVIRRSLWLALCATFFTTPYFHYLVFEFHSRIRFQSRFDPWSFLLIELLFLFLLCFLAALIGLTFSKKYGLPGFGDTKDFVRSLPVLFLLGTVMSALSYFLFDRFFIDISPRSYPKETLYLVSIPFKGAFADEIILRLCLVTIGVGLFRSKTWGVVFMSAVASLFSMKYFRFIGIPFAWNDLFIAQLVLSFWGNLLLGYLFVSRGLLYAMGLKFIFGLKYVAVTLMI